MKTVGSEGHSEGTEMLFFTGLSTHMKISCCISVAAEISMIWQTKPPYILEKFQVS